MQRTRYIAEILVTDVIVAAVSALVVELTLVALYVRVHVICCLYSYSSTRHPGIIRGYVFLIPGTEYAGITY